MDHHWVATSWLSDVGLPQYSQTFQTHLVDGRVLNSLSRRDLERFLNISDQHHQTSLLLAIQLLQIVSFDKEVSDCEDSRFNSFQELLFLVNYVYKTALFSDLSIRHIGAGPVSPVFCLRRLCRYGGLSVSTKTQTQLFGPVTE